MNPAVLLQCPSGISDRTKLSLRSHAHISTVHQLSAPDTQFSMFVEQEIVGETLKGITTL